MSERPIKIRHVVAKRENPILRVEKSWPEPCVVLGSEPTTAIKVVAPTKVVVPLYDNMGPLSRRKGATTLARVASFPIDIFIVEVRSPAGALRYGMLAVPQALEPRFLLED